MNPTILMNSRIVISHLPLNGCPEYSPVGGVAKRTQAFPRPIHAIPSVVVVGKGSSIMRPGGHSLDACGKICGGEANGQEEAEGTERPRATAAAHSPNPVHRSSDPRNRLFRTQPAQFLDLLPTACWLSLLARSTDPVTPAQMERKGATAHGGVWIPIRSSGVVSQL